LSAINRWNCSLVYRADSSGRRNALKMEAWHGYQKAVFEPVHAVAIAVTESTAGRQSKIT